jgi:hypothetical protein
MVLYVDAANVMQIENSCVEAQLTLCFPDTGSSSFDTDRWSSALAELERFVVCVSQHRFVDIETQL